MFANSLTPGPGNYSPSVANKKLKVSFKTKLNPIEGSYVKNPGPGSCKMKLIQIIFRNLLTPKERHFYRMSGVIRPTHLVVLKAGLFLLQNIILLDRGIIRRRKI